MVNKVILIGNVGGDPEVHVFESGSKIVRISVATTERIYNPSTTQWNDHTEWHSVVVPHRNANFTETYVRKGSQVYIEGKLRRREWGEGENRRSSIDVRADEIRLLGRRSEQPGYQPVQQNPVAEPDSFSSNPIEQQPVQQEVVEQPAQVKVEQPNPYMSTNSSGYESRSNDESDDLPF